MATMYKRRIEKSWFKVTMCDEVTQAEAELIMLKLRAIFNEAVSVDLYQTKRELLKGLPPQKGKR